MAPFNNHFSLEKTIPLWLDGKQVLTSEKIELPSPLTGKLLHSAATATDADATAAIRAAKLALPKWSETKPAERRDLLLRAAAEFERRREEFWYFASKEIGAADSYFAYDFADMVEHIKTMAGLIWTVQGTVPALTESGRSGMVLQEPYGVVLAIGPWNAPCVLGARSFVGPIAMGNTVVLKAPEAAPGCYWFLADVFHSVGLPAGVLNTVCARREEANQITTTLITAPEVRKINFTGSSAVGANIAGIAGKHLKPTLMELGGKAPAIVCEDADVSAAALQCAVGALFHAGQVCMSTERILVHKKIAEPFKEALNAVIDQVFLNDEEYVMQHGTSLERVKKLLHDAVSKGASAVYGDLQEMFDLPTRMRPVILENVKEGMDLYHGESFGPTVSLFIFESDEEAIKIANDTNYGLSSAVFTEDLRRGFKIAKQIETGAVHINNMTIHEEVALPHGGAKRTGWGRFNGPEGLKEWVRTKSVTWKD